MADSPYTPLSRLLAGLRALYLLHQTAHWQTRGKSYYGDHLLFQRLYEDSLVGIDGLAEKLIGLSGDPATVSLCEQATLIHKMVMTTHQGDPDPAPSPEKLVELSLRAEKMFIEVLVASKNQVAEAGALTEGLDNLLQGIADKHEEFVYLLQQRLAARDNVYAYDRR